MHIENMKLRNMKFAWPALAAALTLSASPALAAELAPRQSRAGIAVGENVLALDLGRLPPIGRLAAGPAAPGELAAGLVVSTLVTLAIIGLASMFRMSSLRAGGSAVAQQLGGTPVPEDTRDFHLRRLRNVVEEVAIASGVPVPQIFVLEQEAGINAFAAWGSSAARYCCTAAARAARARRRCCWRRWVCS